MALTKKWKISENIEIGFWEISESLENLEAIFGQTGEAPAYQETHHPQKKREWLASRLLLRTMLQERGIENHELRKNEFGKPYLLNPTYEISLSHTNHYAAVALTIGTPIGIDMELPSEKLNRVARKFLSETEQTDAQQNLQRLCYYWCAKEAVYKHYGKKGVSFANHILIFPNEGVAQLILGGRQIVYQLFKTEIEGYMCVCAIEK